MPYNPNIHHRKSIRLKGYDYSQAGLYFITICTQNRACLFGEIRRGEPACSPEIQTCSPEIQSCSPEIQSCSPESQSCSPEIQSCSPETQTCSPEIQSCSPESQTCSPEMILNDAGNMIAKWYIELENKFADIRCHEMIVMPNHFHCIVEIVGADLRVCPDDKPVSDKSETDEPVSDKSETDKPVSDLLGEHIGSPLHRVVQWFKTMSTNEYIRGVKTLHWQPFDGKLWQRNYWEHIIRNENEYKRITEYIINNPENWGNDTLKK